MIFKCLRSCCACLPQRYVMCVFIVTGMIICFMMRVSLYIALNEMTFKLNSTKTEKSNNTECPPGDPSQVKTDEKAEFYWSQTMKQNIISSFFYGYIVAHLPAGVISDTLGGKHVYGGGIVLCAIVSLMIPFLARLSPYAFMAGRVIQGFGQGVMFPSTSALSAKWAPPNERSTMTGIIQSGVMTGNAIGLFTSGQIVARLPGWEPVFYICGGLGLVWSVGWYIMCYNSPAEHPFITEKEKEMILTQIAAKAKNKPKNIPWKHIFTSGPFITAVLTNFGHAWALFTMINQVPIYLRKVLNFDIKGSAASAAAPHVASIPSAITTGYVCDYLIKKKYMSITVNRKVFSFLANTLPAPFLIMVSYSGCDQKLVQIILCVIMVFKGLSYPTGRAAPVDLSHNYAGILMALMNGIGALSSIFVGFVVSAVLTGDGTLEEWRIVFFVCGGVMVGCSVPFLFFGSGEEQPWNNMAVSDPEGAAAEVQPNVVPEEEKEKQT